MALFLKNVAHLEFLTRFLVIKCNLVMQQVSLYFNTKMPRKRISKNIIKFVYFNYYKGKSAKEILDMFSLKIRKLFNIISRAENEGRLDLNGFTGRPKNVKQRVERKTIKAVYDNTQAYT